MNIKDFKAGQKVYRVETGSRAKDGEYVEVTKVGRKWIEVGRNRFDPTTMREDGGIYSSYANYYLSEEEYRKIVSINKAWAEFTCRLGHHAPKGISLSEIYEIAVTCGIKIEDLEK